jgi:hypothetical protein
LDLTGTCMDRCIVEESHMPTVKLTWVGIGSENCKGQVNKYFSYCILSMVWPIIVFCMTTGTTKGFECPSYHIWQYTVWVGLNIFY